MSETSASPSLDHDDFTSWYLQTKEGMAHRELSELAARLLDVLLAISFGIERHEARVPVLEELAIAARIHKGNLRRVINELVNSDVITERVDGGASRTGAVCSFFEIKPDWTTWKVRRRYTYAEEARMERALKVLIEIGKSDPGQKEFSARGFERTADFGAEVSRAFGLAVVHGTTDPGESGETIVPGTTQTPVRLGLVPRTTAPPHGGVVQGTTGPTCSEHEEHDVQSMIHEHEHASRGDGSGGGRPREEKNPALNALSTAELESRLNSEQRHTLEQMAELPGVTDPRFKRTWLLRLHDRNYSAVVGAVGEARHKKAIGWKPNKSWGQYLNDLYHRLRTAGRAAAQSVKTLLCL